MSGPDSTIRVFVRSDRGRKYFQMYYRDPMTGQRKYRSSKCTNRKEAERAAAKWEAELREGRYKPASRLTWEEFRYRCEDEHLATLSDKMADSTSVAFNAVERVLKPRYLRDLTAERLSAFQRMLRSENIGTKDAPKTRSGETVRNYLRHLRAALGWAAEMGLLAEVPKIKLPKKAKGVRRARGRALTDAEFSALLDAVMDVRGPVAAASWRHLLTGLNLSGLRLSEAMGLSWDDPRCMRVDLDRPRPMLIIAAHQEKGRRDRNLPITPDFAAFLQETPSDERTGPVFRPLTKDGETTVRMRVNVSAIIGEIGRAAGVVVDRVKDRCATAQDLRRSFGHRWAPHLMPIQLMQLMRHENIETTLSFYVGRDAEGTADAVWAVYEEGKIGRPGEKSGSHFRPHQGQKTAGPLGFEPRLTDPES